MKKKLLGLCALFAIGITTLALPSNATELTPISILNSPVNSRDTTIIFAQYRYDSKTNHHQVAQYYRMETPVNHISMGGGIAITAPSAGTTVTISTLTDLDGNGQYEWLDSTRDTTVMTVDETGNLVPSTSSTAMAAGERRTLSVPDLLSLGMDAEQARMADGDTPLSGLSLTHSGDLIYCISLHLRNGSTQSYYFTLDRSLDTTTPASQLGAGVFSDVPSWSWYWDSVDWAVRAGMMNGISPTQFNPNGNTTRAALMQVLYLQAGAPNTSAATFTDVKSGDWFQKSISWGYHQGLVNGFPDGSFHPNQALTREQLAVIVYNAMTLQGVDTTQTASLNHYTDGHTVASWAQKAMSWAVANGVLEEMDGGLLNPQGTVSRATLAVVLQAVDRL